MRERRILSTNIVELANEGHGEHRASRETGDGAHAEREESFTRTESVARWSREGWAAYEAGREALLFDFFRFLFLTGVGNVQQ